MAGTSEVGRKTAAHQDMSEKGRKGGQASHSGSQKQPEQQGSKKGNQSSTGGRNNGA